MHVIPREVETTFFVVLCPSDEEIVRRLRARPAERGFTSDEIIRPHVEFNRWFRKNKGKFPLFIDNTAMSVDDTAAQIAAFIAVDPFEYTSELDGTVLTLGPQTSVVLK